MVTRSPGRQGSSIGRDGAGTISLSIGYRLADEAERKGLVNQVGYHYRFVAAFNEAKRLLDGKAIGEIHHIRAEAYGPVVLRPKGTTWRSQKSEGGGYLFDYACHAIDLINYLVGLPRHQRRARQTYRCHTDQRRASDLIGATIPLTAASVRHQPPQPHKPHVKPGISYLNRGDVGLAHEVSLTTIV